MILATLGDVALTWIVQIFIAAATKRWLWVLDPWSKRKIGLMTAAALVMSVVVEAHALSTGLWSYTAINPRLPGTSISIIPVMQLLLLFPVTFAVCRWMMTRISIVH